MGKTRQSFHRGVGEQYAENVITYITRMSDQVFDEWLLLVVNLRAGGGSLRAREMLETAKEQVAHVVTNTS